MVQLAFEPLEIGDYQLVIDATAVTDRAGNILGTEDVVSNFTLKPVSVEISSNIRDIDSDKPGIQVNERTGISLQADVTGTNEVPLENVEFLVNGEVSSSDATSPFTSFFSAPKITPEFDTITIEARGIDSSGYAQVSKPIVVELVDTVLPNITRLNPINSGKVAPGRETVRVEFSEYIAPEAVNSENFKVTDAENNLLEPLTIRQLDDGKAVELNFDPLEIGEYQLEISAANIVDLSGLNYPKQ